MHLLFAEETISKFIVLTTKLEMKLVQQIIFYCNLNLGIFMIQIVTRAISAQFIAFAFRRMVNCMLADPKMVQYVCGKQILEKITGCGKSRDLALMEVDTVIDSCSYQIFYVFTK